MGRLQRLCCDVGAACTASSPREPGGKTDGHKTNASPARRLSKNLARQAKTAEFAASLPEYKKWVDPALIERHWREANTRLDEQEAAKKKKAHDAALAMQATLQSQMVERDEAKVMAVLS